MNDYMTKDEYNNSDDNQNSDFEVLSYWKNADAFCRKSIYQ